MVLLEEKANQESLVQLTSQGHLDHLERKEIRVRRVNLGRQENLEIVAIRAYQELMVHLAVRVILVTLE